MIIIYHFKVIYCRYGYCIDHFEELRFVSDLFVSWVQTQSKNRKLPNSYNSVSVAYIDGSS